MASSPQPAAAPAADVAFARALDLWNSESLPEAHAACREALGHDAGHLAANVLASEILLRLGEPAAAAARLERAVALAPQEPATLVLLARAQRTSGDARAAERTASQACALVAASGEAGPEDALAEAAAEHALALIALGRPGEASAALDETARAAVAQTDASVHWVLADTLLQVGRTADARAAFARAVALDPGAAAWHGVEAARHAGAGRAEAARALLARGLELMPADPQLEHMAAAADGRTPARAPSGYVAAHFDAFAGSFDDVLVERLGYRLPELIAGALERHVDRADLDVLDAGCGTGLCAPRLRPLARRLVGVDLSARMAERAQALGLYDDLAVADLPAWLRDACAMAAFDAIVAADVFVYFGDLRPLIAAAAGALRPGGVLVFTTERAGHGGFALQPSGRFSHDPRHVAELIAEAGLEELESAALSYRAEGGVPVASTLVCARRGAGP